MRYVLSFALAGAVLANVGCSTTPDLPANPYPQVRPGIEAGQWQGQQPMPPTQLTPQQQAQMQQLQQQQFQQMPQQGTPQGVPGGMGGQ